MSRNRMFKFINVVIALFFITSAYSQTNATVTSLLDDGSPGTLRWAISTANSDSNTNGIDFTPGLAGTITLTSDLPVITNNLTILGPGVSNLTISGNNSYKMFIVNNGSVLTLSGITFTANASFNGSIFGADSNNSSIIANSINVTNNTRAYAFYTNNPSTITISNSTFSNNSSTLFGSDYGSTPTTTSDILTDYENRITVTGSTFDNNTGIIFQTQRYVKIDDCIFNNNGSQIGSFGGVNRYQVLNSTFTNNTGATLFIFSSWIGQSPYWGQSTLSANNTLFDGNIFTGNSGIVINPGGNSYYDNKTTISNNSFVNNGVNWSGNPIVSGNLSPANLSNFNAISKYYFDGSFQIVSPSTDSTGAFTFVSSDTNVATISGTTVSIIGAGVTTITATQASDATHLTNSISADLIVNSVSVVTKNGQVSTTNFNFINKNGAIGGGFSVNKNGIIIQTKSYDLSTGLVMHLDAGNISSYPGTGTTWTDLSALGNNGTLINNPVYNSSNGGNLVFNGSNTYVNAPLTKTASCTFSVWAKSTNTNSGNMLFNAGNNGAGPDLFFSNGQVSWNTWDSSANPFGNIPATSANGNWHNYVLVNDAVSNTAKLYYDGVLYGTAAYRTASANTTLYIGGNTSSYMWNGAIGNFQVHNRVLSPAEVVQNFTNLKTRYGL